MKALYKFIVTTESRYNNKKSVDGKELIVNSEITERDARFVNRIAEVVSIPTAINTPIQVGDKIIVHHNVFRTWYDQRGKLKDGSGFLGEGKFAVHYEQVFAYKRNADWVSMPGFAFVAPIIVELSTPVKQCLEFEVPLKGEIAICNKEFTERTGASKGSIVGFTPDSEYEFVVDNQRYYRIYEKDINIIFYGYEIRNKEDNKILESSTSRAG